MIIAASQDESFPIAGVKQVYSYGQDLYAAYNAPERVGFSEDTEEGHGYQKRKREAAYGWFLRWLDGKGEGNPFPEPETVTEPFDSVELRCFAPGHNEAGGPGMIEAVRRIAAGLPKHNVRLSLPAMSAAAPLAVSAQAVQRLEIESTRGLKIPGFLARPNAGVRGLLVVLDDGGKENAVSELPTDEVLRNGWAILGLDPRGIGESRTSKMGWVAAVSLLLGENFVVDQAQDIRNSVACARSALGGVRVGLYARGADSCLAATYALSAAKDVSFYVLDGGFTSLAQWYDRPRSMPASFELKKEDRDRTTSFDREIPFAYFPFDGLRLFDLPDLLKAAPGRGLNVNAIDGDWIVAPRDTQAVREFLLRHTRP